MLQASNRCPLSSPGQAGRIQGALEEWWRTRIAPSATLEAAIEEFLAEGLDDGERLAEIGRLGARLVLQRAVVEEVTALLGRARYGPAGALAGGVKRRTKVIASFPGETAA